MLSKDYEALRQGRDIWSEYRKTHKASDPFWRATLSGADLIRAELIGVHLADANLTGATLTDAVLWRTVLADVDVAAFCSGGALMSVEPSYIDAPNRDAVLHTSAA